LDKKYPNKNKDNQTTEIDLTDLKTDKGNELVELRIENFPNLKTIKKDSENNYKINNLTITNCPKLTSLKLRNPEELTILNITNNNNFSSTLNLLKDFVKLTVLNLSNSRFTGSLQLLQMMTVLKTLNISNTDIDSGLEYLPAGLKELFCKRWKERPDAKVKVISKQLESYGSDGNYDLPAWRLNNLFAKSSGEFKLYQDLKKIADEFAREKLGKRLIKLYPGKSGTYPFINDYSNINAFTSWTDWNDNQSDFYIYIKLDRDRTQIFETLAHELSHALIDLRVWNSEERGEGAWTGKLYSSQEHSKSFWEIFLDGEKVSPSVPLLPGQFPIPVWAWNRDRSTSTFGFLRSKLSREDQEDLDNYVKVESVYKKINDKTIKIDNGDTRFIYFPVVEELTNKIRRKKYFVAEKNIDEEWHKVGRNVLEWVDESMNMTDTSVRRIPSGGAEAVHLKAKDKWTNPEEKKKRWVQIDVWQRGEDNKDKRNKEKFKVCVYHNEENTLPIGLRNKIEANLTNGWEREPIDAVKARKLETKIPRSTCGYKAQIQLPPKQRW